MTRDYSELFPATPRAGQTEPARPLTRDLGWSPFFAQQTSVDEMEAAPPVRVVSVHRNALQVLGDEVDMMIPHLVGVTVGDWLMLDAERPGDARLLDRKSLIKRRAPGHDRKEQMIAANVDTVFVVSSCNQDFNIARLERYVALAFEAEVSPVIVLTKADLVEDAPDYARRAADVSEKVPVVVLDARGDAPARALAQWCTPGATVAFLGSSGVGKSTLSNALAGDDAIATQAIREDDAKGRHTTTRRELHVMPGGFTVLDTPGMRELQLTDAAAGIGNLFEDLDALAGQCRFNDCGHDSEPGCAVLAAIEQGDLDAARVARWRKLLAEDAYNSASLAERRSRDKAFGKKVREVVKHSKK